MTLRDSRRRVTGDRNAYHALMGDTKGSERAPMLPAVEQSITHAKLSDGERGAAALARRYAELMDAAVAEQKYVKMLRIVGAAVEQQVEYTHNPAAARELADAWDRLSAALAEHSVASDLGPKLLAALTALTLTPASKGEKKGKGGMGDVTPIGRPSLTSLRDRAGQRNSSTGT